MAVAQTWTAAHHQVMKKQSKQSCVRRLPQLSWGKASHDDDDSDDAKGRDRESKADVGEKPFMGLMTVCACTNE